MSPTTHDALCARVCGVIRQLGAALDGIAMAAECNRVPGDPAVDAAITIQHLDEAACAVESSATLVHDLAIALDAQIEATKKIAAPFVGGAS